MTLDFSQVMNLLSLGGGEAGVVGLPQVFAYAFVLLVGLLLLFGLATLASRFFRQSIDTLFEVLLLGVLLVVIIWFFFTERGGYF